MKKEDVMILFKKDFIEPEELEIPKYPNGFIRLIKPRTVLRNQCGRLSRVVTLTKVSLRVDECRGRQLKRLAHRRGRGARSKIQTIQ
jgi:hypothetical protein